MVINTSGPIWEDMNQVDNVSETILIRDFLKQQIYKPLNQREADKTMSCRIQFFGVAGYKMLTSRGISIVIDPFMTKNPYCPVTIGAFGTKLTFSS